ncbi:MAG TPA: sugar phosphate isomerase/epimerase family protein [Bryobacteraceae bacterium]|nr:sugar phosphate isomerase/epimerase family protein [Bryobacteraceae bacterium]
MMAATMQRRLFLSLIPAVAAAGEPGPRLRPALCAYSFRKELESKKMSYEDVIRYAAEHKLDGVDLTVYWFPSTEDRFLYGLKQLAYKLGVEIYSISIRTDMCKRPGPEADKEIGEVRKWVDVAAKLGAGHIRVFGGKIPQGSSEAEAAGWVVQVLGRAAEYAGSKGVILGLENHGGITDKAETIVDIVKRLNSPWVAINLDTGNFKTKIYPQIELIAPHAVNVQVKVDVTEDGVKGKSDWDRVAKILVSNKYRGYLALEYEAAENPMTAIPGHLERLRKVCAKFSS